MNFRWQPFSAIGYPKERVNFMIHWAISQWNLVGRRNHKFGNSGVLIRGDASLTKYSGYWDRKKRQIVISSAVDHKAFGEYGIGGVLIHEIGHAMGFDHCCQDNDIMSANLNDFNWFSHLEFPLIWKKLGKPSEKFRAFPVTYLGQMLRQLNVRITAKRFTRPNIKDKAGINREIKQLRLLISKTNKLWRTARRRYSKVEMVRI